MTSKAFIIFSDLDGTLLDYHTYSFEPAQPALELLKKKGIPLVLVSSKTRFEMVDYQARLNLTSLPFVVENGSAVFSKNNYFPSLAVNDTRDGFDCYVLGQTYEVIKDILELISQKHGYQIRGFHNATESEIMEKTSLPKSAIVPAMKREFSIPLFFNDQTEKILGEEIADYNLQILYGGRFMHLLGKTDKGVALKLIMNGYHKLTGNRSIQSIAIGDSLNDFAMLQAADIAVLVKKHDGSYEDRQSIESVIYSSGIGPVGWNQAILDIFQIGGKYE